MFSFLLGLFHFQNIPHQDSTSSSLAGSMSFAARDTGRLSGLQTEEGREEVGYPGVLSEPTSVTTMESWPMKSRTGI